MIGKTLSHFRIVEKIGAGGMGEVYRARDERLERDVALKVLPTGTLADEAARKRFRKEALALSKLNHPNIATVFDFDTQDGTDFLVMELVEGVTLSDKLAVGPLGEKEITRLGAQLAEGLAAAHERRVVHRDLKPANLRVTPDGRLKILDFGLAKLVRSDVASATATTESFTETQAAAGTLPYMAPEQVRAENVDARSDFYAAGAVLYEMATGQRAFPETQAGRLMDAILNRAPQPPSGLNRRVSPGLEGIILKALEKEPENRYQSAKEIGVDLRRLGAPGSAAAVLSARRPATRQRMVWAAGVALVALLAVLVGLNVGGLRDRLLGGVVLGQITSIAVLPLENLMGDPEQDYFVAGMHEALITELSKIGALTVISRTSAMRYRSTDKSVPEIARELGVDAVVEGSVLRAGNTVRITAQLIEAATDRHPWADNFDRELRDVLALHSDVARAIAREIQVALTPEEETRLADARPVNPEAYEAYLKGRYFWNKKTEPDLETGLEYFERAIEKDSNYAAAYAGLADSYLHLAHYGGLPPQEAIANAEAATLKALDIDPKLAEAHASMGHLRMHEWNWSDSEKEFKRAVGLNPNYAITHYWYAALLSQMGRRPEARAEIRRALELDPLSPMISWSAGAGHYRARQYDLAIEQFRRTLAMHPEFPPAHQYLGLAYVQKGLYDEAVAELKEARKLPGADARGAAFLAYAYAVAGKTRQALEILDELNEMPGQRRLPSYEIAAVHAALGQKDQAFAWLEKAYGERDNWLVNVKVEPMFDPLRSDPRFQDLLRRMNFPEN